MDAIKIGPWTVIGLFLCGILLAVGALFMMAFWHESSREPIWIRAALAGLGFAILAVMRTVQFHHGRNPT